MKKSNSGGYTITQASNDRKNQVSQQNHRSKEMGIEGKLTEDDWREALELHNNCCAHCKKDDRLAIDHIIPLTREKGKKRPPEHTATL